MGPVAVPVACVAHAPHHTSTHHIFTNIQHPTTPTHNSYIIFGEAKLEDLGAQAQSAAAAQFASREPMVRCVCRMRWLGWCVVWCGRLLLMLISSIRVRSSSVGSLNQSFPSHKPCAEHTSGRRGHGRGGRRGLGGGGGGGRRGRDGRGSEGHRARHVPGACLGGCVIVGRCGWWCVGELLDV